MHMYGCGWRYRSREDDAEAQTQARGWLCSRAPGGEVHDPWGACEPAAALPGTQGHPGNGPRLSGSHESCRWFPDGRALLLGVRSPAPEVGAGGAPG